MSREHLEPIEETKALVSSVYSASIDSVQMALALVVALAWYSFVKEVIKNVYPSRGDSWKAQLVFALVMSIIFGVVLYVVKNVLGKQVISRPITYAVMA